MTEIQQPDLAVAYAQIAPLVAEAYAYMRCCEPESAEKCLQNARALMNLPYIVKPEPKPNRDNKEIAKRLARAIMRTGDEYGEKCTRIQFKIERKHVERDSVGLCEAALANVIRAELGIMEAE
jgi:hypothetical protein